MDKPYTTYDQQLEILKSKRLIIEDEATVVDLLKRCGYYALISGYKHPFKDRNGYYKAHTTIADIYALYCYDMDLREVFLKYILTIESQMKSLISYSFCVTYGDLETNYLNATNYNYVEANQDSVNKLIGKLRQAISECDKHPYMRHQRDTHGNIPLWVLTRALTIGIVSKMYSLLKPNVQTLISKEFEHISERELEQMIDLLSKFRNVCAHNERLYDYKYLTGEIRDTDVHKVLAVKRKNGRYLQGKKDLFAVAIVFKYLLPESEFSNFMDTFEKLTDDLLKKTRILQYSQIMKIMGLPTNWRDLKGCSKIYIQKDALTS